MSKTKRKVVIRLPSGETTSIRIPVIKSEIKIKYFNDVPEKYDRFFDILADAFDIARARKASMINVKQVYPRQRTGWLIQNVPGTKDVFLVRAFGEWRNGKEIRITQSTSRNAVIAMLDSIFNSHATMMQWLDVLGLNTIDSIEENIHVSYDE